MWPHNCHKNARKILCRIQPAIIPLTIVLLSQQAKKQFLVSTYQTTDYDAIVKTRKKGFREIAKISKSLGIPYFKPISVLFYLFRDRRHTVSTCTVEQNWSTLQLLLISYPASRKAGRSLARLVGLQEI